MMTIDQIETATRGELADELVEAAEYTEDWEFASMRDLRQRVRDVVSKYTG